MEGLEEHRVTAASLDHEDPDQCLCKEEQGLAQWLAGARAGAGPAVP